MPKASKLASGKNSEGFCDVVALRKDFRSKGATRATAQG